MADILLILHFIGMMLTAAGVVGGLFALGSGAQAAPRGRGKGKGGSRQGRVHSAIASLGLVFILPSGIVLLTLQKDMAAGAMFWMKMVFAALLTFAVVAIEMVHNGGLKRAGNVLASLGPLAGMSLVAGVMFSVLAFH